MNKQMKKKVVAIGGGTGLSVLLRGLKRHQVDITAIVAVSDDGGSTGRIREQLGIPAPGDIRNVIAALSNVEPMLEQIFQYRFKSQDDGGELSGHSLGNVILAAMTDITGSFATGVRELGKVLNVKGHVLPASDSYITLHAEMEDGEIVSGESKIPKCGKGVKHVFLTPSDIRPHPYAKRAILEADLIVMSPGSLYTSLLPNLIIPGMSDYIAGSSARKAYICNVMTQHGETQNYRASDHIRAIVDHIGDDCIQTVVVNKQDLLPQNVILKYKEEVAIPVEMDIDNLLKMNLNVIEDDVVLLEGTSVRHDGLKISKILAEMIGVK